VGEENRTKAGVTLAAKARSGAGGGSLRRTIAPSKWLCPVSLTPYYVTPAAAVTLPRSCYRGCSRIVALRKYLKAGYCARGGACICSPACVLISSTKHQQPRWLRKPQPFRADQLDETS